MTIATSTEEEYQDNTDRIEVERFFSLDKRCSGAGLIMTRLSDTTLSSIALPMFVTNLFAIPAGNIFCFILLKAKADQIHQPFHRIRSSVTSLHGYSKLFVIFEEALLNRH